MFMKQKAKSALWLEKVEDLALMRRAKDTGVTSNMLYVAGIASIVASILSWQTSKNKEKAERDRADRWGIFVGLWAPTFIGLGNAMRHEEKK
jgi:hypothetical protein